MFGLFKKKSLTEKLVDNLKPCFFATVDLIAKINGGPFIKIYEAGIYVASIASILILTLDKEDTESITDDFHIKWMSYVIASYRINDESITPRQYVSRLQEEYPVYSNMWADCITNSDGKLVSTLMYQLFCNCTDKIEYEHRKFATQSLLHSPLLIDINAEIARQIKNAS